MEIEIFCSQLLSKLGIDHDAVSLTPEDTLRQVVELFSETQELLADRAIKLAIARGVLEKREEGMARQLIAEHTLGAFSAFVRHRGKYTFSALQQAHAPDDIQKKINKQFGLSDEAFAKYATER